jgi:hypothetical protein
MLTGDLVPGEAKVMRFESSRVNIEMVDVYGRRALQT